MELVHSQPPIWRQLEIHGSLALHQVHQVLQAAFDWEDARTAAACQRRDP
jgi:hypothetical protein